MVDIREVLKKMPNTLRVGFLPGGDTEFISVQAAIDYAATQAPGAANPWTVYIYPGIYTEQITCHAYVHLRGIGPRGSVRIQRTGGNTLLLASNVEIENIDIRATTPGGNSIIRDGGVACTGVRLIDVDLSETTPGATNNIGLLLTGGSTVTLERCYANWSLGTGTERTISVTTAGSTVTIKQCDFRLQAGSIFLSSVIYCANANSEINIYNSRLAGDLANHLVASAGIIRVSNSQYHGVFRSGTGAIVDMSTTLRGDPYHHNRWNWQSVLAQSQVAVRGAPIDAGSNQVALVVTDNIADFEGVEVSPAAAGTLSNKFSCARTPRFRAQICYDADDVDVAWAFGLRQTLANTVPTTFENYACIRKVEGTTIVRGCVCDGTAASNNIAISPITAGILHTFDIVILPALVEFWFDGRLDDTVDAALPTGDLDWFFLLTTTGGGGGNVFRFTVLPGGVQECPS